MSPRTGLLVTAAFLLFLAHTASGESPAGSLQDAFGLTNNLPLKEIAPGVFQLGKVRFDKKERTVSFPSAINQTEGAIEYLIVTSYGKTHESLLSTDAEPYHIQLALLLLGAHGSGTNAFPESEARPLPGDPVTLELRWKSNGKEKHARPEEFVYNLRSKSMMTKGDWIYNGSRVVEGGFVAQQIGSIVSVMVDPDAMFNNPRPGREDDKIWQVARKGLPPLGWPVEVIIRLRPAPIGQ